MKWVKILGKMDLVNFIFGKVFFFYQSFLSQDDSQDSRSIFIPVYHFHPLANIQPFLCYFVSEMITRYN